MTTKTYHLNPSVHTLVEMANQLQKPLLISGKPGTGKTQLAHSYREQNQKSFKNLFQFNTKSTSVYTDLLYTYDAVAHFRNKDETKNTANFISLNALGKAIVLAIGMNHEAFQTEDWKKIIQKSFLKDETNYDKSIVLIDEIDKAPRDFPNDLLNEMDNFEFTIKEIDSTISLINKEKIIVILTSNEEKNLPDAFLRRCLFYFIDFPDAAQMKTIVNSKIPNLDENNLLNKINFFYEIYNLGLEKTPTTSECLDWIQYLSQKNLLDKNISELKDTLPIIIKKNADFKIIINYLDKLK